jgi:hypothetical protein
VTPEISVNLRPDGTLASDPVPGMSTSLLRTGLYEVRFDDPGWRPLTTVAVAGTPDPTIVTSYSIISDGSGGYLFYYAAFDTAGNPKDVPLRIIITVSPQP